MVVNPSGAVILTLIVTVDDTTDKACLGIQTDGSSGIGFVATSALGDARMRSVKSVNNSKINDVLRIKRHFMGNGCGDTAPAVYVISGLTEHEMPNNDFLVMKVEGLCVGGYDVGGLKDVG